MTSRRVQFTEEPSIQVYDDDLSRDKRKQLCWYNESELEECRLDARLAIKLLVHFKGKLPDGINFRGVEKYGSIALQKFKKRRVVVTSVLLRQLEHRSETENKACPIKMTQDLAVLSSELSKPSTLLAHFHAAKHVGGEKDDDLKSDMRSQLEEQKNSLSLKRLPVVAAGGPPSKKRCLVPAAS